MHCPNHGLPCNILGLLASKLWRGCILSSFEYQSCENVTIKQIVGLGGNACDSTERNISPGVLLFGCMLGSHRWVSAFMM